jgi:hypothetical protein
VTKRRQVRATGRKARTTRRAPRRLAPADDPTAPADEDGQISYSSLSLHDLFQQQAAQLLDRTDLDEEQKQAVLVAMSCPCCGAGGMSFTAKIKRRS